MLHSKTLRPAAFALLCALLLLAWQALTVRYSYGGNWTALFCTGAKYLAPPAELAPEKLYVFPNSFGYDGQAYHYIAHDPFFRRGFAQSVDAPRIRYRRILVPLLAWLFAAGRDGAVDAAYIAVVLGFVALGAWWLGRFGKPWLALGFALVPAVLVSIDRMTVDVALAACCVGFVLYLRERSRWKLWMVLAAASLVRETGLALVVAMVLWLLIGRSIRDAAMFSTAALPAVAWFVFVEMHTAPAGVEFFTPVPFLGFIERVLHPATVAASPAIEMLARALDFVALAGLAAAIVWAISRLLSRVLTPASIAGGLFVLLAAFLAPGDLWSDTYSFARTLTPLLLLCALDGIDEGRGWPAIAMLASDPRIALQMGGQVLKVVRGLTGAG